MPMCKVCGRGLRSHSEEEIDRCLKRAPLVRDEDNEN